MKTKLIVIGLVALLGVTVVSAAAAHRFITHRGTNNADTRGTETNSQRSSSSDANSIWPGLA